MTYQDIRRAAETRREAVRARVIALGGLKHGDMAEISRDLHVSQVTISRDINRLKGGTMDDLNALEYHYTEQLRQFNNFAYTLSDDDRATQAASLRDLYAGQAVELIEAADQELTKLLPDDSREPVDYLTHTDLLAAGRDLPALKAATEALTTSQVLTRASAATSPAQAFMWLSVIAARVAQPATGSGYSATGPEQAAAKEVLAHLETVIKGGPVAPADPMRVAELRRQKVGAMKLLSRVTAADNLADRRARHGASF